MSGLVLVLRPEPGATETAARARSLGLEPVTAPLFTVRTMTWQAPDPAAFDAILLTSANAARHGGTQLGAFLHLPCFTVGEATAESARAAGFADIRTGSDDGAAAVAAMAGVQRALHPCGRDHLALEHPGIERRIVYSADGAAALPGAAASALRNGALVLAHSPRAAVLFGALTDRAGLGRETIAIAAISEAVAAAAGEGWRAIAVAARPRDEALLELAAKLCKKAGEAE